MKLQTKLFIALTSAMLITYLGSSLVQRHFDLSVVDQFSRDSKAGEMERHWQWVDCVQEEMATSLEGVMATGDMDLFEKIIHQQAGLPGLQEVSLTNFKGHVAYTTLPTRLHSELPAELQSRLLNRAELVKRIADGSFEIYKPLQATKNCVSCHTEHHPGDVLGVLSLRFSGQALRTAQQSWDQFGNSFSRANALVTIITTGVLIIILAVMVGLCVRFFLSAPIERTAADLAGQSQNVQLTSSQVSSASQTLAEGASEQASSLEETSSSLEEMSSMTKRNSENARKANELAKEARAAADKGVGDMQTMATAMEAIKVSSDDIAKIIKTIDEIAFQTNILALNAAVEAARAGEAGMGFAVVADEVRNLAQRCAQAAKETSGKIEGAITKTGQGVEITSKVAEALNVIVTKVRQVDELVSEVSGASREQTDGITQINVAVGQMDKVTQGNAANAEESAAAAEELNAQAEIMKQSVAELLQLVGGAREAAPKAAWQGKPLRAAAPALKLASHNGNGNGKAHAAPAKPAPAHRRSEIPMADDFKDF